jgi:hypothetical protein
MVEIAAVALVIDVLRTLQCKLHSKGKVILLLAQS